MKKIMFVLLILVVFAGLMAHSQPQYQIKSKLQLTEGAAAPVTAFLVCSPSAKSCGWSVAAVPLGSKLPPIGATCQPVKQFSNELDCGKCYSHLLMLVPPN